MAFRPAGRRDKPRPGDPAASYLDWVVIDSRKYADSLILEEEGYTEVQIREEGYTEGYTEVQWDGGPTYSIHGYSTRRLPGLDFGDLWHMLKDGQPLLTFEILAEGYRKPVTLPVDFIVDGKSLYPREGDNSYPEWM